MHIMTSRKNINDRDIEEGLSIVAHLIEAYGEKYWPIFERLEYELENRRSRAARLKAHIKSGSKDHARFLKGL